MSARASRTRSISRYAPPPVTTSGTIAVGSSRAANRNGIWSPTWTSSSARDGGDDRNVRTVGDHRLHTIEIADVVGVDEQVDVNPRATCLVTHSPLQRRVRESQR